MISLLGETTGRVKPPRMNLPRALAICGGLSQPSKMPGFGYSIPADKCHVGSKLRAVEGSTCSKCYALRGHYPMPNVQHAMKKRLRSLSHPRWSEAMSFLINCLDSSGFFRWHDSGDVQSLEHLEKICEVARATPDVRHWLPTREIGILGKYLLKHGAFPENLTVRLSAQMIGQAAPVQTAARFGAQASAVNDPNSFQCPSHSQGNKCLRCRACWDPGVPAVSYLKH